MTAKLSVTRFKSQQGAERRVRELEKRLHELDSVARKMAKQLLLLARLAAEGPAFDNPLVAYEAKKIRDDILRRMGMGPDGKVLSGG